MPPAGLATGQQSFKTVRLSVQGCLCLVNQSIRYYLEGCIAFNGPPNKGNIIPSCDTIFSNSIAISNSNIFYKPIHCDNEWILVQILYWYFLRI